MIPNRSYQEIYAQFISDVEELIEQIEVKMKDIDKNDPDPERTKAHWVEKLIRLWFMKKGV